MVIWMFWIASNALVLYMSNINEEESNLVATLNSEMFGLDLGTVGILSLPLTENNLLKLEGMIGGKQKKYHLPGAGKAVQALNLFSLVLKVEISISQEDIHELRIGESRAAQLVFTKGPSKLCLLLVQ